jgi:hypothetical protein
MIRLTSKISAAFCVFACGALAACTLTPPSQERERLPIVLEPDRPLYIPRAQLDSYTCEGRVRMVCDGATMAHLLCTCRPVEP